MTKQYEAGYVLRLYCDKDESHNIYFVGRTFLTCSHQAKKKGWRIHTPTKTATCPACYQVKVEYKTHRRRHGNKDGKAIQGGPSA